jgi:HD-GYP domain-containing protein (c-di-GMP phosphodiesterase class II)
MNQMRTHPYQGYKILKEADELSEECEYIVLQHHERYDGKGYPKRLKGDEIHIYGRICCLADVFDALTAERSYKKPMSKFDALKLMRDEMQDFFSRDLLEPFILLFK